MAMLASLLMSAFSFGFPIAACYPNDHIGAPMIMLACPESLNVLLNLQGKHCINGSHHDAVLSLLSFLSFFCRLLCSFLSLRSFQCSCLLSRLTNQIHLIPKLRGSTMNVSSHCLQTFDGCV